jgi:Putative transmembrane protein (PGPGW)
MLTGHHEETVEEAKRSLLRRVATIVAGSLVLALGLALLVLPGPGLIVTAAGLGILASEVPFAARWLEKVRERLPEDEDGGVSKRFLVVSITIAVIVFGASLWLSWMKLTNENFDVPLIPII